MSSEKFDVPAVYCRAVSRRRATSGRSAWRRGRSWRSPARRRCLRWPTTTSSTTASAGITPKIRRRRRRPARRRCWTGPPCVRARSTTCYASAGSATRSGGRHSTKSTCSSAGRTPATTPATSRVAPQLWRGSGRGHWKSWSSAVTRRTHSLWPRCLHSFRQSHHSSI